MCVHSFIAGITEDNLSSFLLSKSGLNPRQLVCDLCQDLMLLSSPLLSSPLLSSPLSLLPGSRYFLALDAGSIFTGLTQFVQQIQLQMTENHHTFDLFDYPPWAVSSIIFTSSFFPSPSPPLYPLSHPLPPSSTLFYLPFAFDVP